MSKAHSMKKMLKKVESLRDEVDDFKYRHSLTDKVGKDTASAVNHLTATVATLREATMKQAFEELDEQE